MTGGGRRRTPPHHAPHPRVPAPQAHLMELPNSGERGVPRYSRRPLPSYRYVPGVQPHPRRDPAGHSYAPKAQRVAHPTWCCEHWRTLDEWLYGVDLFNRFYFWEAHEAWEGLWASAERGTPAALALQGLIQVAAALLKLHVGRGDAARRLWRAARAQLRQSSVSRPDVLGLDVKDLSARFAHYFGALESEKLPVIGPEVPVLRLRRDGDG